MELTNDEAVDVCVSHANDVISKDIEGLLRLLFQPEVFLREVRRHRQPVNPDFENESSSFPLFFRVFSDVRLRSEAHGS